ncbi:RHS repeat-associated core domain-containing protein [Catenuloplanes atrovinosus]|uniref:RHS repeat-associated protein n=1 Tax=Catenuloplanes atrovinosus TaxID=137266 RepID=A0AAE3YKA4_9ACTN|nr:RHS repeat-associated core domain-containing protein [Catenuloplanes atrovinosus]MDR7273969.1 RHS repeat-associated protein [Catenuloplanes atrovinosus]
MIAWRRVLACALAGLLLGQGLQVPPALAFPAEEPRPGRPAGASDTAPEPLAGRAPADGEHVLPTGATDSTLRVAGRSTARPQGAVPDRLTVPRTERPTTVVPQRVRPEVTEKPAPVRGYDAATSELVAETGDGIRLFSNADGTTTALIAASTAIRTDGDTFVMKDAGDLSGSLDLQVGTQDGGAHIGRAYLNFGGLSTALRNKYVNGAALTVYNTWSASCTPTPVTVYRVGEPWSPSSLRWPGASVNRAYETRSFAHQGGSATCGADWESLALNADDATGWTHGRPFHGLSLRVPNEKANSQFKRFAAAESANPPQLSITYSDEGASYAVDEVLLPTNATAGEATVTVTNQGGSTWAAGGGFKLGAVIKRGATTVATGAKIAPSVAIAPMAAGTIKVPLPAVSPGDYTVEIQMYNAAGTAFHTAYGVPVGTFPIKVSNVLPASNYQQPGSGGTVETITPTLYAEGTDPDNWPAGAKLTYDFKLCSGTPEKPTDCVTSGFTGQTWTTPALKWSSTYYWWVRAHDTIGAGPYAGPLMLTTRVPQPAITSNLAGNPHSVQAPGVDPGIGNYSTVATDASVATVGPDLTITRTYNSLDPRRDNAFGTGWSSRIDTRLTEDRIAGAATGASVVITLPTGRQVRFGRNPDGSYAPPQGQALTLVRDSVTATWTLRDASGDRWVFDALGRLVTLIDQDGLTETLRYGPDDRAVEIVNNVSGRRLTLNWSGGHVTGVRANDGPMWTYGYDGDRLTSVCGPDPAPNCTRYEYTSGNHYRTAILNDSPRAYWRLGETSGPTAASVSARSPGNDAGTYTGVVLNADGAIGGSTDRAAVFDGVSSRVALPAKLASASMSAAVELWFKTTESGTLLSSQSGQPYPAAATASTPVLYVGVDGLLYGGFSVPRPDGPRQAVSDAAVNDGRWHHAVLSASIGTQTLYVDGVAQKKVATGLIDHDQQIQYAIGAGHGKDWPATNGEAFHFDGAIDEVAIYTNALSALAIAGHYAAATGTDVLTGVVLPQDGRRYATVGYDNVADRVRTLTDSWGRAWTLDAPTPNGGIGVITLHGPYPDWTYQVDYDNGGRIMSVKHDGAGTFYDYNAAGFLAKVTDPNNHSVSYTTDARGNVLSTQTCRAAGACNTSYSTYHLNAANPLDPRNDKVTSRSDARSSGPADTTYRTTLEYDEAGRLTKTVSPKPAGVTTAPTEIWTYARGTEAAEGGGTVPAGSLLQHVGRRGQSTTYTYRATGDLSVQTSPRGLRTSYTYDDLGRVATVTERNDGGAMLSSRAVTYTPGGNVKTETGPAVRNPITGVTHQKVTTYTYDGNGNTLSVTESDATPAASGGDPARTTSYAYDAHDRIVQTTAPGGAVTRTEYSADGLKTTTADAAGIRWSDLYDDQMRLLTSTAEGPGVDPQDPKATALTLEWRGYDPAGRLAQHTDAAGRVTRYTYYDDGLLASSYRPAFTGADGRTRDIMLEQVTYDPAGNPTRRTTNGVTTAYTYDAAGYVAQETVDPDGLKRTVTYQRDADGNPARADVTGAAQPGRTETVRSDYGPDNQVTTAEIALADGGTLTSAVTYDERGLPRSKRNARLAITEFEYDATGALTKTTGAPVDTWTNGVKATNVRPTETTGYNTFGEPTEARDPAGAVTRSTYDVDGRLRTITKPAYAPPGRITILPVTSLEYDEVGNLAKTTDPLKGVAEADYDPHGNLLTEKAPPVGDQPSTTTYRYNRVGEPLSVTTPGGAQTLTTYDDLGRAVTTTTVEREPGPVSYLITSTEYDDRGRPVRVTSPQGRTTRIAYNGAGEVVSTTDPAGLTSTIDYDIAGRVRSRIDPTGLTIATTFDLAGRAVAAEQRRGETVLRTTSTELDPNGNVLSSVSGEGRRDTFEYDLADRVTAQNTVAGGGRTLRVETGYDIAGRLTRYVDGNKNVTGYTYNVWGLTESTVEPATPSTPDPAQRTWTVDYDAAGQAVTVRLPGGVVRTQEYDAQGRPTVERGTGAEQATADRRFDYDADGRVVRISGAAGDTTFRYNDRGSLVETGGASGHSVYGWSGDGDLTMRTDAAGTATFTYDSAGRPESFTDPITARTVDYAYDSAGRLGSVTDRAASKSVRRVLTYDALNRLATDQVQQTINVGLPARVLLGTDYGYDRDDNVTGKKTYQPAGSTANTYTYDGANRLSTWSAGGATTTYTFDDAGNRTGAGTATAVYNAQNQLVDDGTSTYTYTPRGTLDTVTPKNGTGGVRDLGYDAFERLITDGSVTYGYDGLDRLSTRSGLAGLTYDGTGNQLVSDGTRVVSRDSLGEPFSDRAVTAATGRMLYTDQHDDVTGRYLSASATDTRTYDPFGKVIAATGETPALGYQGGWTDTSTGSVNMAARWYNPESGTFLSRDSVTNAPDTDGNANRYAYGNGDPIGNTDPSGHAVLIGEIGNRTVLASPRTPTIYPDSEERLPTSAPSGTIRKPGDILPRQYRGVSRKLPWTAIPTVMWEILFEDAAPAGGTCRTPGGAEHDSGMSICNPKNWCAAGYTWFVECRKGAGAGTKPGSGTAPGTGNGTGSGPGYGPLQGIAFWIAALFQIGATGFGGAGGSGGPGASGGGGVGIGGYLPAPPPPPPPWIPPLLIRNPPPPPGTQVKPRIPVIPADRPGTTRVDPGPDLTSRATEVTNTVILPTTPLVQEFIDLAGRVHYNNHRIVATDGRNDPNVAAYDQQRNRCLNQNGGAGSWINYSPMKAGVASGAEACYENGKIPPGGSRATFKPRGFVTGAGMARGHLIARELGGSGTDGRNVVALYQDKVNNSAMWHGTEQVVRQWVRSGDTVYYRVEPEFLNNDPLNHPVPTFVNIVAASKRGTVFIRIENV